MISQLDISKCYGIATSCPFLATHSTIECTVRRCAKKKSGKVFFLQEKKDFFKVGGERESELRHGRKGGKERRAPSINSISNRSHVCVAGRGEERVTK